MQRRNDMDQMPRTPRRNETDAIMMLQRYLRQLSYHDKDIPPVSIDGKYGKETENSIRAFQRKYDLTVSGKVDLETWELLKLKYDESIIKHSPSERPIIFPPTPDGYSYGPETESFGVSVLQYLLGELSLLYSFEEVGITNVYDEPTIRAVKQFQTINQLPSTGRVDKETWNEMIRQYNMTIQENQ